VSSSARKRRVLGIIDEQFAPSRSRRAIWSSLPGIYPPACARIVRDKLCGRHRGQVQQISRLTQPDCSVCSEIFCRVSQVVGLIRHVGQHNTCILLVIIQFKTAMSNRSSPTHNFESSGMSSEISQCCWRFLFAIYWSWNNDICI